MNTLREAVQSYLALRRGLGFKLLLAGNALQDFVTFMEKRRAVHITLRRVLQWAQQPKYAQLATWAARVGYVRGFAQYYSAIDPHTEIPPCALMPYRPRRAKPYLYSSAEIEALLQAALTLSGGMGLRPWTYYCFLGLLSVSGLRLGEALDLRREDVDLNEGIVTVRGKFGKIRMVPLHASTRQVLADYVTRRERFLAGDPRSTCLCPARSIHCIARTCTERSMRCRAKSVCAAPPPPTDRVYMIFATDLPQKPCCNGTAMAKTLSTAYRFCPLT
jgi:integrase